MSRLPSTGPSLQRYLRQQARAAQRQQQSSAFALSGTSVVAADVTEVDGTLNVVGNLNVSGPAVITGTLSLPAGIIDNAALTSPVVLGVVSFTDTGFAVTTSWSDAAATTITVPAGCTQLLATCNAGVYASNPNTTGGSNGTGGDFLDCRVLLNGSGSAGFAIGLSGSNGFTSSSSSGSFVFSGLTPGATLAISAQSLAGWQALGSNVVNKANINATLVWLR